MRLRINNVEKWKFSKDSVNIKKLNFFKKNFLKFVIRSVVAGVSTDDSTVLPSGKVWAYALHTYLSVTGTRVQGSPWLRLEDEADQQSDSLAGAHKQGLLHAGFKTLRSSRVDDCLLHPGFDRRAPCSIQVILAALSWSIQGRGVRSTLPSLQQPQQLPCRIKESDHTKNSWYIK